MPNGVIDAAFTRNNHWYWSPDFHNSCALLRASLQGRRPDSLRPRSRILYHLYMRRSSSIQCVVWLNHKSVHNFSVAPSSFSAGSPGQSSSFNKLSCDSAPSIKLVEAQTRINSVAFQLYSEHRAEHEARGGCAREDGCCPTSQKHPIVVSIIR